MSPYLATVAAIARAIPGELAAHRKAYRGELARRLTLRGWLVRQLVRLEPGSRGDDTYRCGRIELVCYPPAPPDNPEAEDQPQLVSVPSVRRTSNGSVPITLYLPLPVLVQIERNQINHKTRAKLQSWGQRPTSGKLVLQLYAQEPDPIPEADLVLALAHHRRRTPQAQIQAKADLRRLSHAVGVNEARYQVNKERALQARRERPEEDQACAPRPQPSSPRPRIDAKPKQAYKPESRKVKRG